MSGRLLDECCLMVIHYAQTLPAESRTVLTTAAPKYRALSLEGLVVAAAAAASAVAEAARLVGSPHPKNVKGGGRGTVVLSDASDATSSGATGNSNFLLKELLRQSYDGSVLFPIACPPSAALAAAAGVGSTITVELGGSLDSRPEYAPLSLEVK